ncbi:unnamed protein product [Orchesella dallaii]|uniref:Odorant receptor n=1 Tax=Orchesella dallaii TaxID=48710 RepID=A0ABP1PI42_9HEXA
MQKDVVDHLFKEILNTRGVQEVERTRSGLNSITKYLNFRPYSWDERNGLLKGYKNYVLSSAQITAVFSSVLLTCANGILRETEFKGRVIGFLMTFALTCVAYEMFFQITTASQFCEFLNGILAVKRFISDKRLVRLNSGGSKVHQRSKYDAQIYVCKLICMSVACLPYIITVISILLPESAFNPLGIFFSQTKTFELEKGILRAIAQAALLSVRVVFTFSMWHVTVPSSQLIVISRLIFPFTALRFCVSSLERYFQQHYLTKCNKAAIAYRKIQLLAHAFNEIHKEQFMNVMVIVAIYHGGRENPAPLLESEVGLWSFTKVEVFSTKPPVESLRECSGENPESLSIMGAEKILPLFWSQRSDFRVLRKFEVFSTEPPVESLRECSGENPESLSIMGAEKTLPVSWSRRSDFGGLRKFEVFSTEPPVESLRECSGENPESLSIMGAEKILPLFWSQRSDFGVLRKLKFFQRSPL